MELLIQGERQQFIPLSEFRQQWDLPDTFQMAYFEPETRSGLGTLEKSGDLLAQIKAVIVQTTPSTLSLDQILPQVEYLAGVFEYQLQAANASIGLKPEEIEFARAGFEDVLRATANQLIRLYYIHQSHPKQVSQFFDFRRIYQDWLDDSARVASKAKSFAHAERTFTVFVVYNAYGRVGLQVQVNEAIYYVSDPALACPAASYMDSLCETVAHKLCDAFTNSL